MTDQLREAVSVGRLAWLLCHDDAARFDDHGPYPTYCPDHGEMARRMLDALDATPPAAIRPVTRYRRTADQMYPDPQGQWLHVSDAGVKEWLQDALLDAAPPGVDVERLAEVLRRHDCDNSTPTACAQGIAAEYARLGEPDD